MSIVGATRSWMRRTLRAVIRRQLTMGQMNVDIVDLTGYSGGAGAAANLLAVKPVVSYVDPDQLMVAAAIINQPFPTAWGLRRISSRTLPVVVNYSYPDTAGADTSVFILDTGVHERHAELIPRATFGVDFTGEGGADRNGHGTHVAGTIAGTSTGVAKRARIISVKVLNSRGIFSSSASIAGVMWAVNNCTTLALKRCVINMSLSTVPGASVSRALNDVVDRAHALGVVVVVAAGNDNVDVSTKSPAGATTAFVVNGIDKFDRPLELNNFGVNVKNSAPGDGIFSSYICARTEQPPCYELRSGTSMAAAHVSGVTALVWTHFASQLTTAQSVIDKVNELSSPIANQVPRVVFSAFE